MAFNLHRTGDQPEWEKIAPEERNRSQCLAAKTKGIVTLANGISVAGGIAVMDGIYDISQNQMASGIFKIFWGRVADVIDGVVAGKTGTKSPLGEAVDASIDKATIAAALIVFGVTDVVPMAAVAVVGGQNLANAGLTAVAKARGNEIHPNKEGKITTFGQWAGIGSFLIAEAVSNPAVQTTFEGIGWTGTVATTATLGAVATYGLAKDAFMPQQPES